MCSDGAGAERGISYRCEMEFEQIKSRQITSVNVYVHSYVYKYILVHTICMFMSK